MSAKQHSPSADRNKRPIAHVLATELPSSGLVLEVASGSGEHCAFFADNFPGLKWQPSDPDAAARASIAEWCEGLKNALPPIELDAAAPEWPVEAADVMLGINMVHISPWAATLGLLAGAGRLLPRRAPLFLYGPYRRSDVPTAPSNEAFDQSLKARNPDWGLREVDAVTEAAAAEGLAFKRLVEMPANNLMLIYRRV